MTQHVSIDPDRGIPDLVGQLADDSKRMLGDELRLAKLEAADSVRQAGRAALWLGVAFGVTVVFFVAATLFVATAVGRAAGEHYWAGALVTGAIEVVLGMWLLRRGLSAYSGGPYTMPDTRAGLRIVRGG